MVRPWERSDRIIPGADRCAADALKTKNETPGGTGTFRLILQSAVSGRALQETVDEKGLGEGTAYVAEDPRVFYMSVESANLDWSFTVEEALFGSENEHPRPC